MLVTPGEPLVHTRLEVRQRLLELGVAALRGLERGHSAQQQGGDRGQEQGPGHLGYQLSTKFSPNFHNIRRRTRELCFRYHPVPRDALNPSCQGRNYKYH